MSWKEHITRFGRFMFFVAYVTQGWLFSEYLLQLYKSQVVALVLSLTLLPGLILWLSLVIWSECRTPKPPITHRLWIVWFLYVSGFVVLVLVIFIQDVENLDKSKFFGPNALIMTLSLLPVLLLLLLITEISATNYKNFKSIQRPLMITTFNFLDGLELLRVLVMQGPDFTVSQVKKCITLVPVCSGIMLSAITLYEHKFDFAAEKVTIRIYFAISRAVLQICLIDIVSLMLRLLWFSNEVIPVICIAKNVIWIGNGILEIISVYTEEDMSENFVIESSLSGQIATSSPSRTPQHRQICWN